jgi:hypothetical protein
VLTVGKSQSERHSAQDAGQTVGHEKELFFVVCVSDYRILLVKAKHLFCCMHEVTEVSFLAVYNLGVLSLCMTVTKNWAEIV